MRTFLEGFKRFASYCDLKQLDEARWVIEELQREASAVSDFFYVGTGYLRIGMFAEAERALEIARPLLAGDDKQSFALAVELATAKLHLGKLDEAVVLEQFAFGRGKNLLEERIPAREQHLFIRMFEERILKERASIDGKSVYMLTAGGLGDNIEQYRNIERLMADGARLVVTDVPTPLQGLFEDSALPAIDAKSSLKHIEQCDVLTFGNLLHWRYYGMPLEKAYRTDYLKPVRKRDPSIGISAAAGKRKIGIVWKSSNGTHQSCRHEPFRSMDLPALEPLLDRTDSQFFSLQFGNVDAVDQAMLARHDVIDASPFIKSMADLAEIMLQLDLVITIDSAPAHLAGALDVPVWNLLAKVSDWRWGDDAQRSTPLYPSMRLFRQPVLGDWTPVIADVNSALKSL
jgi:hypothetical protein